MSCVVIWRGIGLSKDSGPAGELHRYDLKQLRDKFGVEQVFVGQELLHKVRGRGTVLTEFIGEKPALPAGEDNTPQVPPGGRSSLLQNNPNAFSDLINETHERGVPIAASNDSIGKNEGGGAVSVIVSMAPAQQPAR